MTSRQTQQSKFRLIVAFAAGGAIGPMLIQVLRIVPFGTPLHMPLHQFIAVLCPAWLLGPLEYSYGPVATWFTILGANILIWSLAGLVVAFVPVLGYITVLTLAAAYAYWISRSLIAVVCLLVVLVSLYAGAGELKVASAA